MDVVFILIYCAFVVLQRVEAFARGERNRPCHWRPKYLVSICEMSRVAVFEAGCPIQGCTASVDHQASPLATVNGDATAVLNLPLLT